MDQSDCLATPSHFTYLGVCYVGDQMVLDLSAANAPAPVTMQVSQSVPTDTVYSVPEPGIAGLLMLGLAAVYLYRRWV